MKHGTANADSSDDEKAPERTSQSTSSCSGKTNRQRQEEGELQAGASAEPSSSSAAALSSLGSSEISSFRNNEEKKCYESSNHHVSKDDKSTTTHENLNGNPTETHHQTDVMASLTVHTQTSSRSLNTCCKPRQNSLTPLLLDSHQRAKVTPSHLERLWVTGAVPRLGLMKSLSCHDRDEKPLKLKQLMEMSKTHDQMLCGLSTYRVLAKLMLVNVSADSQSGRGLSVRISPSWNDKQYAVWWNEVTAVCWCDFHQYPENKFVLYTSFQMGHGYALIRCMDRSPPADFCKPFYDSQSDRNPGQLYYSIGEEKALSCTWNWHKQCFAVGFENSDYCEVINTLTGHGCIYYAGSNVMDQVFSKTEGGNLMYSGLYGGSIVMHDFRQAGYQPTILGDVMKHHISVSCVRLSPEEHYLYSSDFGGGIKKWDVRMQKEVLRYEGISNYRANNKMLFHIDDTQSILYSAGEDCHTRMWNLETGQTLLTIPPPYEASTCGIPSVRFSTHWGGRAGNMGLIMQGNDNFYLYGVNDI